MPSKYSHLDVLDPVEMSLSLVVVPGIDNLVIMLERLGVDVVTSLKEHIVRGAKKKRIPPYEIADVAIASMEPT